MKNIKAIFQTLLLTCALLVSTNAYAQNIKVSYEQVRSDSVEQIALKYLNANLKKNQLSKSDSEEIKSEYKVVSTTKDSLGMQHVRIKQYYQGMPVIGATIIVHLNKDMEVSGMSGQPKVLMMSANQAAKSVNNSKEEEKTKAISRAKEFMQINYAQGLYKINRARL